MSLMEDSNFNMKNSESTKKVKIRKSKVKKSIRNISQQIEDIHRERNREIDKNKLNLDEASWQENNNQKYLEISASDYYNLGLLEGKYLLKKIRSQRLLIKAIATTTRKKGYEYARFLEMARSYEDSIPDSYLKQGSFGNIIDEIQGIADGISGISFEEVFLQNCFIDVVYGELLPFQAGIPNEYEFGCTSFGAMVKNNNLNHSESIEMPYIGQNFDFNLSFKPSLCYVLHKVGNSPKVFSLRLGGMLSLPTGKNGWGLKCCINIIKCTIPGEYTIPTGILSRMVLTNSHNIEEAYKTTYAQPNPNAYNIMMADKSKILSCETIPTDHIRRDISTYYASSNTFVSPEYQQYLLEPNYSKKRQEFAHHSLGLKYALGMKKSDFKELLSYKPIICRTPKNPFESRTLAFFTNDFFGLGDPAGQKWGLIPSLED
ncbi:hypothetical protein NEF87_001628 [Candidatus Lokiarchaeum ossiferum]|uniref:Peptidase C45 hydrolase domain-containing protein n=1 Tax=Candidatus Lokiarchaeum ossiferum TaxID=2951803 RepID=A0ABY6HP96_9ARCH|nr:hypothetical protein NEF87_001628 [Candidatus Lokiarchaeum sp. B-35]